MDKIISEFIHHWICSSCNKWNFTISDMCTGCNKMEDLIEDKNELLQYVLDTFSNKPEIIGLFMNTINNNRICCGCLFMNKNKDECEKCKLSFDHQSNFQSITLEYIVGLHIITIINSMDNKLTESDKNKQFVIDNLCKLEEPENSTDDFIDDLSEKTLFSSNNNTDDNSNYSDKSSSNEHSSDYALLLNYNNYILNENDESFFCVICQFKCEPLMGFVLHNCQHSFCKSCAVRLIKKSRSSNIQCPIILNQTPTSNNNAKQCPVTFESYEIKALLTQKSYHKYTKKCFQEIQYDLRNILHCNGPYCDGFITKNNSMEPIIEVTHFICPLCSQKNCIKCKAIHETMSCDAYERLQKSKDISTTEHLLKSLVKYGDVMECPKCEVMISKDLGCDGLRCAYCKVDICWITKQARWGPAGPGDTSGGCKCLVDNIRCHPNCITCH